jgi:hypothetical protein
LHISKYDLWKNLQNILGLPKLNTQI